ncbi:ABC transporter permease [bacterium]|nr:ABC transporter permease [bacterium]
MTTREIIALSAGNLWRQKLRASLTIAGVIIAIGSFVAMLSFGIGMQKRISEEFENLGLFTTMQVFPAREGEEGDSLTRPLLNDEGVERLSTLPGVRLAYPMSSFDVEVTYGDTSFNSEVLPLPSSAFSMKYFTSELTGETYPDDSSHHAVVTHDLLDILGMEEPEELLGDTLVLQTRPADLDSAIARVIVGFGNPIQRIGELYLDSLQTPGYVRDLARREMQLGLQRFVNGYFNARPTLTDTIIVSGVTESAQRGHLLLAPILVSPAISDRLDRGSIEDDPVALLQALRGGTFFSEEQEARDGEYSRATLNLDPAYDPVAIKDSVEAVGYRALSYVEEFNEMRKFFLIFDSGLGIIGLIALIVASLGIVNTMIMSILERTEEIGVLKSLGADDSDIHRLFLVESGIIGVIGAAFGIVLGWVVTRIASLVAQQIMRQNDMPVLDIFHIPWWLILFSIAFGLLVSLLAGLYPAARAARVDPVKALRGE